MRRFLMLLGLASLGLVGFGAQASAGGGGCHESNPGHESTTTLVMEGMCFRPGVAYVAPGDTVTVVNRDQMLHNLYGSGGWFAGELQPGDEASHTFDEPGTYAYACTLHPGMVGAVVVGDPELASSTSPAEPESGGVSGGVAMALTFAGLAGLAASFAGGLATGRRRSATTEE